MQYILYTLHAHVTQWFYALAIAHKYHILTEPGQFPELNTRCYSGDAVNLACIQFILCTIYTCNIYCTRTCHTVVLCIDNCSQVSYSDKTWAVFGIQSLLLPRGWGGVFVLRGNSLLSIPRGEFFSLGPRGRGSFASSTFGRCSS